MHIRMTMKQRQQMGSGTGERREREETEKRGDFREWTKITEAHRSGLMERGSNKQWTLSSQKATKARR